MAGRRSALVIANDSYQDPGLQRLRAPVRDADALARVLGDPAIGNFEVQLKLNLSESQARRQVAAFFSDRRLDDLLLLHFSCHGVKDADGLLYFAAADTELQALEATGVPSEFVNRQMTKCRSRRILLLLDCCYSGAFARGMTARADKGVDVRDQLGGHGRAVITASSSMEYAFEGGALTQLEEAPSIFTSAVVRGLETGDADGNGDGQITVEELYQYVYDEVRNATPNQRPRLWTFDLEDRLVIARAARTRPAELPGDIQAALQSQFQGARADAVGELARLAQGQHRGLALAATMALQRLAATDDSLRVRTLAGDALAASPSSPAPAPAPRIADPPVPQPRPPATEHRPPVTGARPPVTEARPPARVEVKAPPRPPPRKAAAPTVTRPRREWLVGVTFLLLIAVAVAWLSLRDRDSGATTGFVGPLKQGGTVRFAAAEEPLGFNPNTIRNYSPGTVLLTANLFPRPFHVRPDYTVQLDQTFVDSVTQTSEDPQRIVYQLNRNAVWSDGTPVSARDFIWFWEQQNGSVTANEVISTAGYERIKSVRGSSDGKTVTVVFNQPYTDWRSLFAGLLPSHFVSSRPGGWNTGLDKELEKIPSAGPFRVSGYARGRSLTMVRNDRYWGTKANLDSIVFQFPSSSATDVELLQGDQVDVIDPPAQADLVRQVRAMRGVESKVEFGPLFEQLVLNFRNGLLADSAVRQAIATGIDTGELVAGTVKQFGDQAKPLGNRIWVTGQPEYQDHLGRFAKGDVAAAQALLEQAGYRKGADGIYAKRGKRLSLRLSTTTGNALREAIGTLFRDQMRQVGIEVKLRNTDSTTLFGTWLPKGEFDIALFAWTGTPFAISNNRDVYRTNGPSNYGHYSNQRVDQLFEQALAETDRARAVELGQRIDQLLAEDVATVPLFTKPSVIAYRSGLANIGHGPGDEGPFWNSGVWGYKA